MHPRNPYAPTSHFNVRCIIVTPASQPPVWWFGGGFDLTPYYGFVEDCVSWHQAAKASCDPFGEDIYLQYKQWADRYFYLEHRNEPRGIGGIFFDDLNQWSFDSCFQFIRSVGTHYLNAYQPILAKRQTAPYGDTERAFQLYRRGRYVEFNLLYDRGTLFGLQSKGYANAILMSLPPVATWPHTLAPTLQAQEKTLLANFLKPRDWHLL